MRIRIALDGLAVTEVGDPVNLESEIMLRYVAQAMKKRGGSWVPTPPRSRKAHR